MSGLTYRITTLGCRVNHAESRAIESVLRSRGLLPSPDGHRADLEVVHTCTVTHAAAAKSRQAIRRARRRGINLPDRSLRDRSSHSSSPGWTAARPEVIVTGCYTGTDPIEAGRLAGDPGAVIPHHHEARSPMIDRFAGRVDEWLTRQPPLGSIRIGTKGSSTRPAYRHPGPAPDTDGPTLLPLPVVRAAPRAGAHVRAEVHIQDGCDAHCTFCIIPSIRRTLRSKRIDDVVEEVRRLVDLGHREIVLTGVFIGAYGHETALRRRQRFRSQREPLADLLDAVARVDGLERLRLSSMEPGDVTEALLDAMVDNAGVIVPHLHLPLQSGSDRVLRSMNRQYGVADYLEMIDRVDAALTSADGLPPAITTDVICGFPGEDEADFDRTVEVARCVGYMHMHVFPFSPRAGTAAARWRGRFVPPSVIRRRVRQLIRLETDPRDGLSIRYRRRLAGRVVRVILEQPDRDDPGLMTGRCDHYARVWLRTDEPRGSLLDARITEVRPDRLLAEPVASPVALPVVG